MASLATARTRLGLYGGPLKPGGDFLARVTATDFAVSDTLSVSFTEAAPVVEAFDSRTGFTQRFSQLGLNGVSRLAGGDFTKEVITLAELDVTDAFFVTFTEDPVDFNEIIGIDDYRLTLTEAINLRNNQAVTDNWPVALTETISLLQSGVTLLTPTDTWSVTFTEGTANVRVSIDVTDTLSSTFTLGVPTIATPLELKTVTDDFAVTLTEEASLGIFAGVVPLTAFDTWSVTIDDDAVAGVSQPVGAIKFRIRAPSIKFEFV